MSYQEGAALQTATVPLGLPVTGPPSLSVVLLTWNEERNIRACLDSLARQADRSFEVIVLDAASTDRTVEVVREAAKTFPVPLRLEVSPTRTTVGAARNHGVALARADVVAFLSADAEADPRWVEESLGSIGSCDVLYGRQVHAPGRTTLAACVRGLRYHYPESETPDPARYASNVNAVVRKSVLQSFPFGTSVGASAVDDMLLTQRSKAARNRIAYNPGMVVHHHDVESVRGEFVKNLREGLGWGEHRRELGVHRGILSWSLVVLVALATFLILPIWAGLILVALALWAPAARRVWRRRSAMPAGELFVGALASPAFDLAFLVAYLRGLASRNGRALPLANSQETQP